MTPFSTERRAHGLSGKFAIATGRFHQLMRVGFDSPRNAQIQFNAFVVAKQAPVQMTAKMRCLDSPAGREAKILAVQSPAAGTSFCH